MVCPVHCSASKVIIRLVMGFLGLAVQSGLAAQPPSAPAEPRPWNEYRVILWMGDSVFKDSEKFPIILNRIRQMGVNTGMVHGQNAPELFLKHDFPYYVENMVNKGLCLKWNSNVRDWDAFITGWTRQGRPQSALVRDYSLDDPVWRRSAAGEVQQLASKHRHHSPVAFDIRDELSTTVSANPFDYDFHPATLVAFRAWLRLTYLGLPQLNLAWETKFETWDAVHPFTTDQIKNRMSTGLPDPRGNPDWQALQQLKFDPIIARTNLTRWNFSPWADFRTYMDLSLARTLNELRAASREQDPATPVGIEGTQMPHAFGGYDLWRLSQALDWVEPYDIANAREIFGSFMPGKPILSTVFEEKTDPARRRLWHLLLEGDKGCIIWWSEDCIDWKSDDLRITPKGQALTPVLKELTSELAALFLRAKRIRDPIFIHYSQPSIQLNWLLESTLDGPSWVRRFSSYEADHNRLVRVRNGWLKLFQDLGFSPQFLSADQLSGGALQDVGPAVLVLPGSLALSDNEARAIGDFIARTPERLLFGDDVVGAFDEHCRLRPTSALATVSDQLARLRDTKRLFSVDRSAFRTKALDISQYPKDRLKEKPTAEWREFAQPLLRALPKEVITEAADRVRVHRFSHPLGRLLAFEQNIDYHMSEDLKQAGGNEALETPRSVVANLMKPAHVYDLWTSQYLGETNKLQFDLSPWQPSLFAVLKQQVPADRLIEVLGSAK